MTKREGAILTAYTGRLFCKLDDFYEYVDEITEQSVFTHELGNPDFWAELKKLSEKDFREIMNNLS